MSSIAEEHIRNNDFFINFDTSNAKDDETMIGNLTQADSTNNLIDAYMEMQKTNPVAQAQPLSDDAAKTIVDSVGGQDAYNDTLAWAADNLKPEEVAAYDNVVNSGNKDAIFFAVQALNQRYKDSTGFEGQQISGRAPKNTVKGFRSNAELANAISDPRYRNDPAYRYDIEQKLAASGDLM